MWLKLLCAAALLGQGMASAQTYPGIGRAATPAEIKAWDIDVRADFKGLPAGSGSAVKGSDVWEGKCASCHGVFGESNAVFPPLVGGTTKEDMVSGKAAGLINGTAPYRTTLMKISQLSTLWDYINRAMPWNAPKSLSTDEVYAVTAYLLNLGGIVPDDFVLSDKNIAQVQATLPNRNGKTLKHGLWHVNGKPDVRNTACMVNCGEGKVTSILPDYVRNAHGNLAEQNRGVGPYRGIDTTQAANPAPLVASLDAVVNAPATPPTKTAASTSANTLALAAIAAVVDVKPILTSNSCTACHGMNNKILGPAFSDISKKHAGKPDSVAYLTAKIKKGSAGAWGAVPMPAQSLSDSDAKAVAQWLVNGMKQ